ncbi:protein kinase domain-containing protein [Streptomyces sp. WI04-05B]|uniref:protein kinase domain-containing protein n=1 Tax=Streptomyces TaxID=1883 RepID=UPI0029A8C201|nr:MULTISPECIES: protein kinase [unclassified Streptomyces]MDX2540585.1 protein kinase [Streptomyces sp. WI04-05B]MDX2584983.1 protein kinase [Streptomyces sp. WI04-05A]MDX3749251.1 protein kinase [Streptomyces sp. AK08-02]
MTDEAAALRQAGAAPLRPADPERIGPYVPLALLGSGGMGRVYLARPSDDGPGLFAVKVIRPEYAEDPTFRRRFEQEALVHGRVRSPRAPRLCGTGFQDELLWMATEYLAALDLTEAVREGGALGSGAVWRLVAELGQALADLAATGIVHRDLKPSNVLLSLRGAHVIDFGISKAADASAITGTGNRVGTPAYMSPEYLRTGHCDATSDVFSLAGTLIYAAVGRAPFGDGTGVDVMHRVAFEEPDAEVIGEITAIDPALGALLAACLSKEPERRPTPRALVQAARECAGESAEASRWPEPLLGRVLERQRAYDVLYRVPVARAAELRLQGHRPNPALPVPVQGEAALPVPAAESAVPAVASDETSPGQRRPRGAVGWARRRPVPAAAAGLALCGLAALAFVLASPEDRATASPPGAGPTASAGTDAEGGDALPKPGTSDGKSGPSTSGNGTETVDGHADPAEVSGGTDGGGNGPADPDTPTGTDTTAGTGTDPGTGTGTDPGTDGGTGTTPAPTPTPSPVTSTTEPASAPWTTDCTYFAGKARTAIGDTGKRVKQVQCILMLRGYDIGGTGVDGVFGEGLEAAMKHFQEDKGLVVDGIVKRVTWDNLRASK